METNLTLQMSTDNWITDKRTGKQYMVLNTHDLVYDDLQQWCSEYGGFLPEPKDEQENQFLDSLDTDMFALGMTDRKEEGVFVWDSDGSPVTWTSWIKWTATHSEPNGGPDSNCVIMARGMYSENVGHRTDGWVDYNCNSYPYYKSQPKSLICQKNPGMCQAQYVLV